MVNLCPTPHLRIVSQQFADQVARILVLEDITVAPQPEQSERQLQMQAIARQAAIGAEPGGVGAQAVPGAVAAVGLQQGNRQLFTNEVGQIQIGRRRLCSDVKSEQFVDRLAPRESLGHRVKRRTPIVTPCNRSIAIYFLEKFNALGVTSSMVRKDKEEAFYIRRALR